jgi:IclR family transcriptional regulator, mhp operon transcriptional activator
MTSDGSVRALERGLDVLQVVNQKGGVKAAEVAKITGIPRPTVYRLLETLESQNFVSKDFSSDKWRPTLYAKSLSAGFRDEDWVSQTAVPAMSLLSKEILWPIDLVTYRNYEMTIRESTHSQSPYSVDHGMVGLSLPILDTSGGRAHLAFSPAKDRELILEGVKARLGLTDPIVLKDGPLERLLDEARKTGVGLRREGYQDATMSFSAPIFKGTRVVSCLTIIWIRSALKLGEALDLYRDKLLKTAKSISDSIPDQDEPVDAG